MISAGTTVVGFATLIGLGDGSLSMLEYMAVAERARGTGAGARLLAEVLRTAASTPTARWLYLEVERPSSDGSDVDQARRIDFYRRNGARVVRCLAEYPIPSSQGDEPLDMCLMYIPLTPEAGEPEGALLARHLRTIYGEIYGLSESDPVVRRALSSLSC